MAKVTKNAAKKKEVTKTAKASKAPVVKAKTKATKVVSPKVVKATTKGKAPVAAQTEKKDTNNPYRENGAYWTVVECLRTLGVDTIHPFESIIPAFKKQMGLNWSEFKNKKARNDNGLDAESRIIQNVAVVARKDYGKPLVECGFEVRYDGRQKVAGLFKIGGKK